MSPGTGMELGPAENRDVPEVARVWCAGWYEAHLGHVPEALVAARPPESFSARAAERVADTIVARARGDVAGFVMVRVDEVDQLYVAAAFRGSGVAGRLLDAAERRIVGHGHSRAWLAVVPDNKRARAFYAGQGWGDDGWFEHEAPGPNGPVVVPCHRYTKDLQSAAKGR